MATRKTVKALDLVSTLHTFIAGTNITTAKAAYCMAIEEVLHAANAYAGFGYTFYTFDVMNEYGSVDAAIAAGKGTEYDRTYYTTKLI